MFNSLSQSGKAKGTEAKSQAPSIMKMLQKKIVTRVGREPFLQKQYTNSFHLTGRQKLPSTLTINLANKAKSQKILSKNKDNQSGNKPQ